MAVGRISGPLLKANLIRNGVDLAFETDLLYLDVNNGRIGIKKTNPSYELDVNGTVQVTDWIATNSATTGNLTFQNNTISSTLGTIELTPSGNDPVIYHSKIHVDSLELNDNYITTLDSNAPIELRPNGTGTIELVGNTNVTGNLYATGNITAGGNISLGDQPTDTIAINADLISNIIPDEDDKYTLGTPTQRWKTINTRNINVSGLQLSDNRIETIDSNQDLTIRANGTGKVRIENLLLNEEGNTYYVTTNGSDTEEGTSVDSAYATIKKALSVATSGDIIKIASGTYTEIFPLVVPAGVGVVGAGLRSTIITGTAGTINKDCFHLDSGTTVENLTIKDMKYDAVNDTGYAYAFNPAGISVPLQSPYIINCTVLSRGTTITASDPYGFDSGDAGRGAKIDGSLVTANSLEAAMLFNDTTFFIPNQTAVYMTNGARVEWLNCFIYFADKGIYAVSGNTGRGGDGKTKVDLTNYAGTFSNGDTVTLTSEDGSTVLASGVIESSTTIDGNLRLVFDGKVTGFVTNPNRNDKTINLSGDAQLSTTQKKYGTASLYLDGTGDYATVASTNDFGFGTGNFTVEGYFRFDDVTGTKYLFDLRSVAGTTAPSVYANGANIRVAVGGVDVITGSATLTSNTWYHIAIAKSNDGTKLFINGSQDGSTYSDTNNYGTARPLAIGADYNNANVFAGYVDEVRITKGLPRYLANFTALTSAFVGDLTTVFLTHFDGQNSSTTVTEDVTIQLDISSSGGGTATGISNVDLKEFGAELRSIGSANVYGNQGVIADGPGVVLRLINHNFGYMGVGKRTDNDVSAVIQANEITETNGGKVLFSSIDQSGDFRVGNAFTVDQETGNVTFEAQSFDITSLSGLTFTDGGNTTIVDPNRVETGNIRLSGNQIITTSGDLTINPDSTSNVNVEGNLSVTGALIKIQDTDQDTKITVESDFNQDEDTINFYVRNSIEAFINTDGLTTSQFQSDEVRLVNNSVQTYQNNNNLEIFANGTGYVDFADTDTVRLPRGSNAQRPGTPVNGMLRYNTQSNTFEGYASGFWNVIGGSIGVPIDQDQNTYITAELTTGANDDTFRFYNGTVLTADLNQTRLNTDRIHVNTISTEGANANLTLTPNGTGKIVIGDVEWDQNSNTITQTDSGGTLNIGITGEGYVDFTGTYGVKFPVGTNANRPTGAVVGQTRYNTEQGRMEVWDGSVWASVVGQQGGITFAEAEELSYLYAIIMG